MKEKIKKILKNTIVDALLLLALGIALLIWPDEVSGVIWIIAGAVLAVMGIVKIVMFFTSKNREERSVPGLIIGIVQIILAILIFARPDIFSRFAPVFATVLIGYGAVVGIARAVDFLRDGEKLGIPVLILAIVTLVTAVVVLINPEALSAFHTRLIGIGLIAGAVTLILTCFRRNKAGN